MSDGTQDEKEHLARTCFVIGPIGSRYAEIGTAERDTYEQALRVMSEVIEPACKQVGLEPVRADTLAKAGEITDQIFRRLRDDDVVIADLTGANANVMYELGLRHTRDKITIHIGEHGRLPFDVNQIRTVVFSPSPIWPHQRPERVDRDPFDGACGGIRFRGRDPNLVRKPNSDR